ncbi:hypothetical protein [Flexivirga oryzae]|uniref:Uncharacterized protein n=1 Tax=Flexivirga oryzae TaxID=1794944 RepID=A0A839N824_9MICO|nr:hypothetical protein [Flexivirga oryzae]MBB2892303.1 hypothetical protein [Flexivirga oryzae]
MAAEKETPDGTGTSSVADEAARLAQAFSTWAQNGRGTSFGPSATHESVTGEAAACGCTHGDSVEAVCRMCPVCRAAGLLQAVQPELLDRVADLLSMVAGGLRSAAEERRTGDATHDDAD